MTPFFRRGGALFAVTTLAVSSLTALSTSAARAAEPDPAPFQAAAAWLAAQPQDGLLTYESFGSPYTDYGLSIDAGLALHSVGGQDATVQELGNAIAAHLSDYSDYTYSFDGHDYAGRSSGAVAKSLVMLETAGIDPTDVGGVDLVQRLEELVLASGATDGRIADDATRDGEPDPFGDYANTLGQAFAVKGLDAADSTRTNAATEFLLAQQCTGGWFRESFSPADAADQSCDAAGGQPSVDATAQAVLALLPQSDDVEVLAALGAATDWLESAQTNGGAFDDGTGAFPANANSTGLAGWALGEAGRTASAERAAIWLRRHQAANAGPCLTYHAPDLGAVAYDDTALAAAESENITPATLGQWLRASAQALPALRWAPSGSGDPQVLFGPEYVRAGSTPSVGVVQAAPGEALCAHLGSRTVLRTANAAGEAHLPVRLPGTTGVSTVRISNAGGAVGTARISALGPKTLPFELGHQRRARGVRQLVEVRGLAPAELVSVLFRGKRVASGQADEDGRFAARFPVKGALGDAKVKVVGQFPGIRNNVKTFTVTS